MIQFYNPFCNWLPIRQLCKVLIFTLLFQCANSSSDYYEKGLEMAKNGKLDEAQKLFTQAIDKDDENELAFNARGVTFFEQKDYNSAQLDFEAAMKLKPDWYKPYFNRALLREAKQDVQGAIDDFNLAIKMDSSNVEILQNKANLLAENQRYSEAQKVLEKADLLAPNNKNTVYNLANIYFQLEDYAKAKPLFEKAINLDPNFVKAQYGLAILYINQGDTDNACLYLGKASAAGYEPAKTSKKVYCK